ncbi:sugar ABC transporter permease [Nonomuraea terrae]|uniref:Sugar ABC transporter permease n=1 Tax=Nonomuraea terrae TaxID=2530383 RepID=A0A4R4Y419_9ACTN|nr:sugar ABC transporter permease [Nonomuraea terrae]TDD39138.1 sugar ABC transporter permease [Nonomuraea terrae]
MPGSPRHHPLQGGWLRRAREFSGFALPGLFLYGVLVLVPIVWTIVLGFTDRTRFEPQTGWAGLGQFSRLFQDDQFWLVLKNTFVVTLIVVIVPNVLGLGIALLLNRESLLYRLLRSVFFTPVILSGIVVSVIWQSLLRPDGVLNAILVDLGVDSGPRWLSDPDLALYSISGILCWQMLGFCVVVYIAGLNSVPKELHEAALMDGAGPLRRFRSVTWPMIAASVTINTVMLLISGFKVYEHILVLTNGGPGRNATASIAFDVIEKGVRGDRIGAAAAEATIMLAIIVAITGVVLRLLQRREVHV